MVRNKHTGDGTETQVDKGRRFGAFVLLALLLPAVLIGAATWILVGGGSGAVVTVVVFAASAVALTIRLSMRARSGQGYSLW